MGLAHWQGARPKAHMGPRLGGTTEHVRKREWHEGTQGMPPWASGGWLLAIGQVWGEPPKLWGSPQSPLGPHQGNPTGILPLAHGGLALVGPPESCATI